MFTKMWKKLIYLVSFVVSLGLVLTSVANAADPNLVGWWKLDETSGTIAHDSSGNGHDGILMGTPQWVPGQIGGALELDGVDDYVETIGYKGIIGNQARTVTAWIKTSGAAGRLAIISWGDKDNNNGKAWALTLEGGKLRVEVWGGYTRATTDLEDGNWHHVAAVLANDGSPNLSEIQFFIDGNAEIISAPGDRGINTESECDLTIGSQIAVNQLTNKHRFFPGLLDDVRLYNRALTGEEIQEVMKGVPPSSALNPSPDNEATDMPREAILSWEPGEFANTHDVYFGTNLDDVSNTPNLDPMGPDQVYRARESVNSYVVPERLDFGQTYYWRVDEVNAPPTSHVVFKGEVWQFTVEPIAYPIESIVATASSSDSASVVPENTINGSGLDADDLHSVENHSMWLSSMTGAQPTWIQYEFERVYKLHQMWVWNHNTAFESMLGFGLRDVIIEYSTDDADWKTLGDVPEFAQAPGADGYEHNTTVNFGGTTAKYVRLTVNSNWGGIFAQYGLSEVRFFYTPVLTREPDPESGTTDVSIGTIDEPIDVTLGFRAAREAASHDVYLSSDEQAVIDGTAPVTIVAEPSYGPLSLDLGQTYYWRVDEVNEAETPATWQGDIWNFRTQEFFALDDFEDYNDLEPDRIFDTWIDGWDIPTNGSTVGYPEPDFAAGEHFIETSIVHSGRQSMPYFYDNSAGYSEATVALSSQRRDWTIRGISSLSLWFRGHPASVGSFMEAPAGTYTMTASGADIWGGSDEFHYAYKEFTGVGAIIAKVESVGRTHNWAKAGVMIRDTLDPDSVHAMVVVTPAQGISFERRATAGESTSRTQQTGITAPQWVQIERNVGGIVRASYSADGIEWTELSYEQITMNTPMYIGLALTAHKANATCEATFSNVQITGQASPQWMNQDIGILSNDPEPMYVALANSGDTVAVVYNDDPNATQTGTWTEWNIDLKQFTDQGVNMANVDKLSIGFGDRNNPQPGTLGKMYFDDIRLYPLREPEADLTGN